MCKENPLFVDVANGVTYRIMEECDIEAASEVAALSFFHGEPVGTIAGKATLRDMNKFVSMVVPRMARERMSLIAVDKDSGEMLGVCLNADYCATAPEEIGEFMENSDGDFIPLFTMVEELEQQFNRDWNVSETDRPAGNWFHIWMLGVKPQARGKRISSELIKHTLELAKAKDYLCAFAECTGAVSTHIFKKYKHMSVDKFIDYSTWDGCPNTESLRSLPPLGHLGMSLVVCRF